MNVKSRSWMGIGVLSILLMSLLVTVGCSSGQRVTTQPRLVPQHAAASTQAINREQRTQTRQTYVGIYDFGGDDWSKAWEPRVPEPPRFNVSEAKETGSVPSLPGDTVRVRQMRGYRVQLANVTTEEQARSIESRARAVFETVYVIFQSPSYKIRGGDFRRRSDADQAAAEARRVGFRGAWVVPDRIRVYEGGRPPAAGSVSDDPSSTSTLTPAAR
jgi:hypothetical protein